MPQLGSECESNAQWKGLFKLAQTLRHRRGWKRYFCRNRPRKWNGPRRFFLAYFYQNEHTLLLVSKVRAISGVPLSNRNLRHLQIMPVVLKTNSGPWNWLPRSEVTYFLQVQKVWRKGSRLWSSCLLSAGSKDSREIWLIEYEYSSHLWASITQENWTNKFVFILNVPHANLKKFLFWFSFIVWKSCKYW